jgi:hypothetical protein
MIKKKKHNKRHHEVDSRREAFLREGAQARYGYGYGGPLGGPYSGLGYGYSGYGYGTFYGGFGGPGGYGGTAQDAQGSSGDSSSGDGGGNQ